MPLSKQMRRLQGKWETGGRWPKRLEWIEVSGIRGWRGQRFELRFPIMAVVGENGAGKSTILQAAASVYAPEGSKERKLYAGDFFPDTAWDKIRDARIGYSVREGQNPPNVGSIRKPSERWRGNEERRKRSVAYIDLRRIQPVPARLGYVKIANSKLEEAQATLFDQPELARISDIMGRRYDAARMANVAEGSSRWVPVLCYRGSSYSGFHQGAGETTVAELLETPIPSNALVLIDEIESSLHPRAQRRLMHDLADRCREEEWQVVLTTHSPYVLEELPLEARAYIVGGQGGIDREFVYGVSPDFAMTRMDEIPHPEIEVYVEDNRAERMVVEILAAHAQTLVPRCQTVRCGSASVGQALGQMVAEKRFLRPTCVFLDGDRAESSGCNLLPGDDAPERVVFDALRSLQWGTIAAWGEVDRRVGRSYSDVADTLNQAMTMGDHHDWVRSAASNLTLDSETLWQAMVAEWATKCLSKDEASRVVQPITDLLSGITSSAEASREPDLLLEPPGGRQVQATRPRRTSTERLPHPELFPNVAQG